MNGIHFSYISCDHVEQAFSVAENDFVKKICINFVNMSIFAEHVPQNCQMHSSCSTKFLSCLTVYFGFVVLSNMIRIKISLLIVFLFC